MLYHFIQSLSLPVMTFLLFAAIFAAAETGTEIGRRRRQAGEDPDPGSMATAALGLLALLIAFTYSMAVARYDVRRHLVLEEANAIGSTGNFALMLPQADQAPILDLLRHYTSLRLTLGEPYARDKLQTDIAQSAKLQAALWQKAVAVTTEAPQSLPAYRFVGSLNEMNNIGEARVTALRNHVPAVIVAMLALTAVIAMGFAGYGAGAVGTRRRVGMGIMSLLLALLIGMTQDLQRPDRGSIEVSTQALADALAGLPEGK